MRVADQPSPGAEFTIRPKKPALTNAGQWFQVLSVPWFFGAVFFSVWSLTALGLYPDPAWLRLVVIVVAFTPVIVAALYPWLRWLPGLGWLYEPIQPRARLDVSGIELSLPGQGTVYFQWEDVAGLVARADTILYGNLLGMDGSVLAKVPRSLVYFQDSWLSSVQTLASRVVGLRPDRYAISGARSANLPDEFALIECASFDVEAAEQRRERRLLLITLMLGGVTAISIALWTFLPR